MTMEVVHRRRTLKEVLEGLGFPELDLGVLVVEEVSSFCRLHDHIDHVILQQCVPNFDDVGMIE